jgi:hypothetical protein
MRKWRVGRFLAALAGLSCLIGMAQAGPELPPRSHVPVPSRGGPVDPQQLFNERMRKADMFRELREHIEKASGKKLDDLLKDLKDAGIDPSDPKFAKLLQEQLDKQAQVGKNARLSPQQLEALQRLFKDLFPEGIKLADPWRLRDPNTEPTVPSPTPGAEDKPPTPQTPAGEASSDPEWVQTAEDREALENASRQLIQAARWLENYSESIRNSPALQRAATDLARILLENSNGRPGGLDSALARWSQFTKQNGWLMDAFRQLRQLKVPSFSAPSIDLGSGPQSGALERTGAYVGGLSGTVLWAIGIGVTVWLVLRLLRRFSWGTTPAADDWRLGPWPVAPSAVASRTDLIRAFEHLSLLLLGRKARNWNHREIASRMGTGAAERLAALYEQARYAPQDEPLPEEAVAEFRRDLCLLAGGQGA